MTQFKWLCKGMGDKFKYFILSLVLSMITSMLYVAYPFLTKLITDDVLVGTVLADGTTFHNMEILPKLLIAMVVVQLFRTVTRYCTTLSAEYASQNLVQDIKAHLYKNLGEQDYSFYDKYRTGDLMTRFTGDMDLVRHVLAWICYKIVESVSMFVFAVIYFSMINVKLTLLMLAIAPFITFLSYRYSKTTFPYFKRLRAKLSELNTIAQENISGNKAVQAFVREEYESGKFDKGNRAYRKANLETNLRWVRFYPVIEAFSQSFSVITVLAGGMFIIMGEMSAGDIVAFSLMTWAIATPMREIGTYLNDIQRFSASCSKIMEVYDAKTNIKTPENGATKAKTEVGEIIFDNVSFTYDEEDKAGTLKNLSLTINQGETIAVMGATGSGKTTFISAITRSLDVTSGKVSIGGIDVKEWDLQALRKNIGVATQDVLLYSNTVDANISFGDVYLSEQEVKEFAYLASASFIDDLQDGYNTIIGERGTGLSGGQKQRISLARALAIKPSILILDDTTSAVDMETEHFIQENLANLPFECTKIIIAQRISSVKNADKILILDKGEIAEFGAHDELVAKRGYYYEICKLQGAVKEDM